MTTITTWLDGLGLAQYEAAFIENAIDMGVLQDLTEADLERLGVALGHRKRMLRAIGGEGSAAHAKIPAPVVALSHSQAERRQITVLFCDLVGSTPLAVKLDPEDLRDVIRRFQDTSVTVIAQMGGYIARFMGDGILAYFGYPQAHEDDAERAVRAGLDLVAKINHLLDPTGEPLRVRVGIATGTVIVGDIVGEGSTQEHTAVGETPNVAARLQSVALPDSVVIATSTQRLLGSLFVCEVFGSCHLKGLSGPVTAWRVAGERVVESRFAAIRSKKLTRFVGRQNELHQLLSLWRLTRSGHGQVALLCGEAGIGKSRMCETLLELVARDTHFKIRMQCSPYQTNTPFYSIISQHEHAACFEREDSPEVKLNKLEALLSIAGQAVVVDTPLYAALMSIPTGARYPALELTPRRQKELTIDALIRQLLGLAHSRPLLLVVEDVHWIDPSTLETINRCIESIKTATVLLLITFRPEFFPSWLDQPHVTMVRLNRLKRENAGAMIFDVAGGKALPAEVFEPIISKTDGVPLFVEELTKMVLESGLLHDAGDRYLTVGSLPSLAIPTTLHDSLMARLDRLTAIKEIAQIGAAIGREFSYRLIAAVAPTSGAALQAALSQLTGAELIFGRGEPPDSTYIFKHALLRDAAYASLLRGPRQQLHQRIADALKEHFAELVETQPQLIAYHLAEAGLVEPAIGYLRKAGQRAIERSANSEAIGHLKRALELLQSLPDRPERQCTELGVQVMLARAMIADRGYAAPETMEALLHAKTLMNESTEVLQKCTVLYGIWACHYVGGEVARQQSAAVEFLVETERHGNLAALSLSHRTLGTTYVTMGDFAAGRRHLERARELYALEDGPHFEYGQDIGAAALCYLCWALWHLGYVDQASAVAAEAMKRADTLAHPFTLAYTICHARGMMDVFRRCPEGTRSYASLVNLLCTEHNFPFWSAGGQILDGWAATYQGKVDEGIETMRAGLAAWRKTGARLWLPIFLALEAEAHAKAARVDSALQIIDEALTIADETGERWAVAEVLRIKAGLLLTMGRATIAEVEILLVKSLQIAQQQQALCWQLRTACDLVRLRQGNGRTDEVRTLLQSIYDQFTEGFGTADLLHAKALLETLRSN